MSLLGSFLQFVFFKLKCSCNVCTHSLETSQCLVFVLRLGSVVLGRDLCWIHKCSISLQRLEKTLLVNIFYQNYSSLFLSSRLYANGLRTCQIDVTVKLVLLSTGAKNFSYLTFGFISNGNKPILLYCISRLHCE